MTSTPGKARRPASLLPLLALLCLMPMAARPAAGAAEGLAIPYHRAARNAAEPAACGPRRRWPRPSRIRPARHQRLRQSRHPQRGRGFWAWWHGYSGTWWERRPSPRQLRACWSRRRSRPSPPLARRRLKSTWPSRRGGCRHAFRHRLLPTRCRTPRRTSWQSSAAARSGGRSWRSRLSTPLRSSRRYAAPAGPPSTAAARRTPTATSE